MRFLHSKNKGAWFNSERRNRRAATAAMIREIGRRHELARFDENRILKNFFKNDNEVYSEKYIKMRLVSN